MQRGSARCWSRARCLALDLGSLTRCVVGHCRRRNPRRSGGSSWFRMGQVREAQKTREEQAQPFVVVDFDRTEASRIHMDLVIVNTGTTLAKDVRVAFDPPLRSTLTERNQQYDLADAAIISHGIPTMPPGREFRMLFESMPGLFESDLPRTYGAVVSFRDSRGRPYQLDYRLDQRLFRLDADRREG